MERAPASRGGPRPGPGGVSLPTFVTDEPFTAASTHTLGEDAAHHMRVRRLESGSKVRLLDGVGRVGVGTVTQLAKRYVSVAVETAEEVEAPTAIHLLLPVADRDRMLWLAEKATELGVASWRPVVWKRSRNVTPRGEGTVFQQKARARMVSALAQSGGAWLPAMFPDATVETAIASCADGVWVALEAGAPPLLDVLATARRSRAAGGGGADPGAAVTIAVGPEGGLDDSELAALDAGGFRRASLGASVLRFETAALAGIAAVRASLETIVR